MIKVDGLNLSVKGNTVELLTELTGIMHDFYEKGIASKKDLLDAVNLATASDKDLTDMLIKIIVGSDQMQCISLREVVAVKQYSEQLMQIIEHCESIQEDDGVSDYHKERAKVHAYEDIVALVKVRR